MAERFKEEFERYFSELIPILSSSDGDWIVKGFIDIYKNIYTISLDTKVVSKIIELMLFPKILEFSNKYGYEMVLCSHQNHYPDITFIDEKTKELIAFDMKSTYRITPDKVNGMTLGAFTGYFRNRESTKNITFPYKKYSKHYILGVVYSRTDLARSIEILNDLGFKLNNGSRKKLAAFLSNPGEDSLGDLIESLKVKDDKTIETIEAALDTCTIDEKRVYTLDDLQSITSVARDFDFFLQEKWKIASDRPGSGNTKNIGSTLILSELKNGTGLFTQYKHGYEIFNDYWMNYQTKDMALAEDLDEPLYKNIETYFSYKEQIKL